MNKRQTMLFRGLLILGILLYLTGGILVPHSSRKNRSEIEENIALLEQQANKKPTNFTKIFMDEAVEKAAEEAAMEASAIQEKVLQEYRNGTLPDNIALTNMLQGTTIVGDSIVSAGLEYGFLNSMIVHGQIGVSLETGGDLIDDAISCYPAIMYLCFGVNDIENYVSDVDAFISEYEKAVNHIRDEMPDVVIYICALFPPQPGLEESLTFYQYLDQYNARLEEFCAEKQVNYIDCGFILREQPELYDTDGIHPYPEFYPIWFEYLADIAGLN